MVLLNFSHILMQRCVYRRLKKVKPKKFFILMLVSDRSFTYALY